MVALEKRRGCFWCFDFWLFYLERLEVRFLFGFSCFLDFFLFVRSCGCVRVLFDFCGFRGSGYDFSVVEKKGEVIVVM